MVCKECIRPKHGGTVATSAVEDAVGYMVKWDKLYVPNPSEGGQRCVLGSLVHAKYKLVATCIINTHWFWAATKHAQPPKLSKLQLVRASQPLPAAAMGRKNQQRTKYSLDGNVPKSFPNFCALSTPCLRSKNAALDRPKHGRQPSPGSSAPTNRRCSVRRLVTGWDFSGGLFIESPTSRADPPSADAWTPPETSRRRSPTLRWSLASHPGTSTSRVTGDKSGATPPGAKGGSRWRPEDQWERSDDQQKLYEPVETRTLEYLWRSSGGNPSPAAKDGERTATRVARAENATATVGEDCGLNASLQPRSRPLVRFLLPQQQGARSRTSPAQLRRPGLELPRHAHRPHRINISAAEAASVDFQECY